MRAGCRNLAIVLCLSGVVPVLSHAATPAEQAFIDGKAAGQSATSSASANITNGTIATTVNSFNPSYYNYSSTAPEAGYFMGGSGDTITPGAGKVTACQTGPVNPNAFLQQNCEAINYMVQNPTTRPQFTINPGDPNVARSRIIEANPGTLAATSLGYASPSAIGAFAGCTTQTITTPPTYTTEICNEYLNATSQMCVVGRTIVVDADANYQCNQTVNAYQTQTCNRTLNAVVVQPPSILATNPNWAVIAWPTSNTFTVNIYPAGWAPAGGAVIPTFTFGVPATKSVVSGYYYYWSQCCGWSWPTISYDGAQTISMTLSVSWMTYSATYYYGPSSASGCPTGYTWIANYCVPPATITATWANGCATQQAAAL